MIGSIALRIRPSRRRHHDGTKERNFRSLPEDISLQDLVPEDNFYRRLQEWFDLSFVREMVEDLYAYSG
jgi:hypothetical protein